MHTYTDATEAQINETMLAAQQAAPVLAKWSIAQRAVVMRAIADALENSGDALIHTAMAETNLPEARLRAERARTVFQWRNYADACCKGYWLETRIDTAQPQKVPPRPDIRKMMVPLGPVVVFGSSNFPFAYSTAGGDTASAMAAGCPVVVKAHPAHPHTGSMVAALILQVLQQQGWPAGAFGHVYGAAFEVGKALVMHPCTKAVGFTGSFAGGKALFDWAQQRPEPIPVFAEMGSVNPVFLLPQKLGQSPQEIAAQYAASITLGVGQFCTNPGILVALKGESLSIFSEALVQQMAHIPAGTMLHSGIAQSYIQKRQTALELAGVTLLATGQAGATATQAVATMATVSAAHFLANKSLHHEVFGPFSLLVVCEQPHQMVAIAKAMEGQLTATLMATDTDLQQMSDLVEAIADRCGRLVLNGVPTGVEVCDAMQHGGPFPATTDSRYGSVGADALRRFCRPLAFQNWPNHTLPAALQNENKWQLLRCINGEYTRENVA